MRGNWFPRWLSPWLGVVVCSCGSSGQELMEPAGNGGSSGAQDGGAEVGFDAAEEQSTGEEAGAGAGGAEASAGDAAQEPAQPAIDPALPGPCNATAFDSKAGSIGVHCVVPSDGPYPAPYPAVLFAHGFQIDSARYNAYIERLGTYCYVGCTVDYNNLASQEQDAAAMVAALDWAIAESAKPSGPLAGKVDSARVGGMGHSRGGKAAVVAAAQDARFRAVLGLDPVNACPPLSSNCPDAVGMMSALAIPTGFLGETTDSQSSGLGQACAPADGNYQKFYQAAQSPSLEVTVLGANHMSFVADLDNCIACGLCKKATADHQAVLELSLSYTVAFFERWLREAASLDDYLTGSKAQERYVQSGQATLQSK